MRTFDSGFEDHLATRRSPLFLEPLGHHLVPDGPSGRVAAAVVPGAAKQYAPGRAVQRQTASYGEPAVVAPDGVPVAPLPVEELDVDVAGEAEAEAVPIAEPIAVPTVGESLLAPTAAAAPAVTVTAPPPTPRPSLVRAPEPALPALSVPAVEPIVDVLDRSDGASDEAGTAVAEVAAAPAPPPMAVATNVEEVDLVGGTPQPLAATAPAAGDAPAPSPHMPGAAPRSVLQRTPVDASPPEITASRGRDVDVPAPVPRSTGPSIGPAPTAAPAGRPEGVDPDGEPSDAPDQVTTVTAVATADETPSAPTLVPMRTVLGAPIASAPARGAAAHRGPATVQREPLGVPAPGRTLIPAGAPKADPAAPSVGAVAATADDGPPATRSAGEVTPELPTLGVDALVPVAPLPLQSRTDPTSITAAGGPGITSTAPPASATAEPEPTRSRPTLSGEWLPTAVARQPLDDVAAAEPAPLPQHASAQAFTDHFAVGTLGGSSAPLGPSAAAAPRRTIIGPPISRVQRAVLPAAVDHPRLGPSPSSPPATVFDARHGQDTPVPSEPVHVAEPAITEWPPVQREPLERGATATADEAPVLHAEATSGPAALAAAPPAGRSDAEVDELLRTLYPSLRRRLCRDLLLDRERAGYGTDIRF